MTELAIPCVKLGSSEGNEPLGGYEPLGAMNHWGRGHKQSRYLETPFCMLDYQPRGRGFKSLPG